MKKCSFTEIKNLFEVNGYTLLDDSYVNSSSYISLIDKEGFKYYTTSNNFKMILKKNEKPEIFCKSNIYTIENMNLWCVTNKKEYTLSLDEYKKSNIRNITITCNKCKNSWEDSWCHIKQGCKCKKCRKKGFTKNTNNVNLLTCYPDIAKEWDYSNNLESPENYYPYSSAKVHWICSICNKKYVAAINNRTIGKTACPKCKTSKGEKRTKMFLENNNIEHVEQHVFPDCKSVRCLPFDFYLPRKNTCIEYQGEQHYKQWFGNKRDDLFSIQQRDKIKKNYCHNNNINLIVIPYLDYKNIEVILSDLLNIQ